MLLAIIPVQLFAQQKTDDKKMDDKKKINNIIEEYSRTVIERDEAAIYAVFNDDPVIWYKALMDRSQKKRNEKNAGKTVASNYSTGSYQQFFQGLSKYKSTEDKFDNIRIVEDGTVASVAMDYSFWADGKMTNWGGKYLGLIKRDGKWKITSVIYSIELAEYFPQPSLKERQKQRK